jgi:hypothetical protein
MTKKHFIALADIVRSLKPTATEHGMSEHFDAEMNQWRRMRAQLGDLCASSNPRFNRDRWLGYIAGTHGKNGGKVA